MRLIEQIGNRGRRGVFIVNLEYKRKAFDKQVAYLFRNALNAIYKKALDDLEMVSSVAEMTSVNFTSQPQELTSAMKHTYGMVGKYFAKETYENVKGLTKADDDQLVRLWESQMRNYVENEGAERIKLISHVNEKEFKRIVRDVVSESLENKLSIQDAAKMIRDRIGFSNKYRSLRIARTEIVSASNYGSITGAKSTLLPLSKVWISVNNNRSRHSHKMMNNTEVGIDDSFKVPIFDNDKQTSDYDTMYFPGDPKGSAGNVINCRCTQGYKVKR